MKKIFCMSIYCLVFSILSGCGLLSGSLELDTTITTHTKIITGTYNFIEAAGGCKYTGYTESDPVIKTDSIKWRWVEVPKGSPEPEIVELYDSASNQNIIAFIPSQAGNYKIAAEIGCSFSDKSTLGTVEASFAAEELTIPFRSTTTLQNSEGENLEEIKDNTFSIVYDNYSSLEDWYTTDFNGDGSDETLIILGSYWEMISITASVEDLFMLIDTQGSNGISAVYYLLGVDSLSNGSSDVYAHAVNTADNWVLAKYSLNYNEHSIVLAKIIDYANLVYGLEQPMVIYNGNPTFLGITSSDISWCSREYCSGVYIDKVLSFDKDNQTLTSIGEINIIYDYSEFISLYDYDNDGTEEIIYKIGSEYFVYEY